VLDRFKNLVLEISDDKPLHQTVSIRTIRYKRGFKEVLGLFHKEFGCTMG
jgi:hypothetical protein